MTLAAALEQKSEHPLAKAILRHGESLGLTWDAAEDFTVLPGSGVRGTWNGSVLLGGNRRFMEQYTALPEPVTAQAEALAMAGKTPLYFSRDGQYMGIIAVADTLKEDSPEAIRQRERRRCFLRMGTELPA